MRELHLLQGIFSLLEISFELCFLRFLVLHVAKQPTEFICKMVQQGFYVVLAEQLPFRCNGSFVILRHAFPVECLHDLFELVIFVWVGLNGFVLA